MGQMFLSDLSDHVYGMDQYKAAPRVAAKRRRAAPVVQDEDSSSGSNESFESSHESADDDPSYVLNQSEAFYQDNIDIPDDEEGWKTAFAVVEGRRFLYWDSVSAFDSGELAVGGVLFSGHAGITSPSPLEVRGLENPELVVTLFGKGPQGQQRLTLRLTDATSKTSLENILLEITTKDD